MKSPLDIALDNMTSLLARDHSERDWKWSVLHVLRALAIEVKRPPMQIPSPDLSIKSILEKMEERLRPKGISGRMGWGDDGNRCESTSPAGDRSQAPVAETNAPRCNSFHEPPDDFLR